MSPVAGYSNDPLNTISRRGLLGGAVATLAGTALPGMARAQRATPAPGPRAEPPPSWLVVAPDSRDSGSMSGDVLAVSAPSGAELARIDLPGIKGAIEATGDPRKLLAPTWDGPRLVTLDPLGSVPVAGAGLSPDLTPDEIRGDIGAAHPDWAVLNRFEADPFAPDPNVQIALARLDRAEAVDIWPWIGGDARYPPFDYRFSASGAWLATWYGADSMWTVLTDSPATDSVSAWLVPTADPPGALRLGAGRGISTAATVSPSERLVACTVFDPDTLFGAIVVEPVAGGDAIEVVPANMWSRSLWLPGDADRLITFGHGEVALHEFDTAGAPSSTTLARGVPIADEQCGISADGRRALFGARPEPGGPPSWQWLDLERGEAVALPALDGLGRERTSAVTAWPRWLLFRADTWPGYDPLVGLDMDTGETAVLVDLMERPEKVGTSADGRFAILGTDWEDTLPARLVDVASGAVTPLWTARTQMVRSGVVSPDGSCAAIHAVANAGHALEVLLIDTADPAAMQPLSPGAAALWTGELS